MSPLNSIILALGLASSGFFVGRGIIQFKKHDQVVSVRGLDERMVDSNEASWSLTFSVNGQGLPEVYAQAGLAQKKVKDYLLEKKFKESDIVVGILSLTDNHANSYSGSSKHPYRYSGRVSLSVNSNDVDAIERAQQSSGELIKREVQLESNSIVYKYTELNAIKPEMIKTANQSARLAAESFAHDTGSELGKIKNASQGLFTIESPDSAWDAQGSRKKKIRVVTQMSFFID